MIGIRCVGRLYHNSMKIMGCSQNYGPNLVMDCSAALNI